ncbi:hypothetical protein AALO_G00179540 [Alosa alosa]|uniref:Uncharacterized protein n=1 Tax=Alosa alosa TaxID=278164 RepID=A0AAV6G9B2_9TELE|nr:hypothetical protein AALO_G00179540 [Alosa alosa]
MDKPPVSQIIQHWPALFVENQVSQEFSRVVGENLKQDFSESLDRLCPKLVEIIRSKRGLKGQLLDDLLRQTKTSDTADIRCLVLRGLPILFDDNSADFFKTCFVTNDEGVYRHIGTGILCFTEEDIAPHPLTPSSVGIVLEGTPSVCESECGRRG